MATGRKKNSNRSRVGLKWQRELWRHAIIAGAFALLAIFGRASLVPIQAVASHVPHGLPFSLDTVLAAASFAIRSPTSNVPITLVDIDESLYREWGRPCFTPRDKLAALIEEVASRSPAAIVVDVSLTCSSGTCCAAEGPEVLEQYLRIYKGAPLILVREMHVEFGNSSGLSSVILDKTPFDGAVATNEQISWAHTFYMTDQDGTVRDWREYWEACEQFGASPNSETVASVPTRVLSVLQELTFAGTRPELPSRAGHCSLDEQSGQEHIVMLGSRVVGPQSDRSDASAPRRIAARLLLNPEVRVDEEGYYRLSDRVAIIGASHSGSRDQWRTSVGYMSGMELIAHTLRFSATQLDTELNPRYRTTLLSISAFFILVTIYFFLRPLLATLVAVGTIVALATGGASIFMWLDIFESLEIAIWLFIGFELTLALTLLVREIRRYPRWRKVRSVLAERVRQEDPECHP